MFQHRLYLILTLVFLMLSSATTSAQSAKAEQQKLASYESQLKTLQADIAQQKKDLDAARETLKPLQEEAGPEKAELDAAAKALEEAKAHVEADPSDTNKARLKNAEFKHALAERKFKKANEDLFEQEAAVQSLTEKLKDSEGELAKLQTALAKQKVVVEKAAAKEQAQAKARAERKAKEAEQQRLKAEADAAKRKAERERMQREEAARKAAAAKAAAAKPTAPGKPAKAAPPGVAQKPQTPPAKGVAKGATKAAAAPKPAAATGKPAPKPKKQAMAKPAPGKQATSGAIMLTTRDAVKAEQQRLEALLAKPDRSKSRYNKILNVKPLLSGGETGPAEAHALQALGHNQYRGQALLKPGKAIFVVGFNSWQQEIPGQQETTYIVILDGSNPKQPRLVYYPESLAD